MPLYDARCTECGHEFEERRSWKEDSKPCPLCKGSTRCIWKTTPSVDRAKDPYDYLDGHIPAPKQVKSFAKDHRKGGKDTS